MLPVLECDVTHEMESIYNLIVNIVMSLFWSSMIITVVHLHSYLGPDLYTLSKIYRKICLKIIYKQKL